MAKPKSNTNGGAGAPTADYLVASPVNHDGELYVVDDTLALTEAQAEPLLACGAVKAVPPKA